MNKIKVYFSLGSNLGDRLSNITKAIGLMEKAFEVHADVVAQPILTEPQGFVADEKFINTAVRFSFADAGQSPELHALSILRVCKNIEEQLGRKNSVAEYDARGVRVYKSRTIDIDIILYGDVRVDLPELTIPHKEMRNRDFVMIPLREIIDI